MIVQNKNNKGNPYHDEEGQFTTADGVSGTNKKTSFSKKDIFGDLIDFDSNNDDDGLDSYFNSIEKNNVEDTDIDSIFKEFFTDEEIEKMKNDVEHPVENLTDYDYVEGLGSLKDELDVDEIFKLSLDEQKEIVNAYYFLEKKNLDEDYKKLEKINQKQFYNLWPNPVSAKDYLEKKDKIEIKRKYYLLDYQGSEENKNHYLNLLDSFEQTGKEYLKLKDKIDQKYSYFESLVSKYDNPNSLYSRTRKNNAVWVKNGLSGSIDEFSEVADKAFDSMTEDEKNAIIDYTSSYSFINEPLRGATYYNSGKKKLFVDTVKNMTNAIDKSFYDKDVWLQRGVNKIVDEINGVDINGLNSIEDLTKLIGKTFRDEGFLSCGAAKNTGFTDKNVIMNLYCPKGTKMLYVAEKSHYGSENEMILQRGYSYKIKKVEKKNGKIYLDLDVLLGTDKEKYDEKKLKQINKKYFPYE